MTTTRRPGRPRSAAIDAAILDATIEELIERGFASLTMESVAARAGVAKTTIYRRWPNTVELGVEAMRTFEADLTPPPDGSVRDQLVFLVDRMRRKWNDPRYGAVMRRVTADGLTRPELYRQSRERLVGPHLEMLNATLARGVREGLIDESADLEWIRQLMTSPIMAATLTFKERVSRAQIVTTVDTVLRGVAP